MARLRDIWHRYRPRARESDGAYNGPLSTYREYHALIVGLAAGFLSAATGRWELALAAGAVALGVRAAPTGPLEEVRREPWYTLAGLLLAYPVTALVV
jgi:hypothetical protein